MLCFGPSPVGERVRSQKLLVRAYGLGSRRSTPELHPRASHSRAHSGWNQPDGMYPVNHASEATRVSQMMKPQAVPSFGKPLQCQGRRNVPCAEPLADKPPEVRIVASIAETRDIVVIGASSGGVEALSLLVQDLAPDLPAAVFAVLHIGATSNLAQALGLRSRLPVLSASSGHTIERGKIYVGVPGAHLLLHDNHVLLRRGPHENLARPAIDPLFRSAAATFGGRVIGVVLSGALSDGTAGLRAIKRCGGLAVVQDPADALVPAMPRSAMRNADVDHVVGIDEMADLLQNLIRLPAGPTPEIPLDIRLETAIAA